MPRPLHALVSPAAIAHNLAQVRARLAPHQAQAGPSARVWAVIKANAYGHGIERVLPGLATADGLAMLDLDEAVRCREAGWGGPILLLEGIFEPDDIALCRALDLTLVLHCAEQLRMLETAPQGRALDAYLKLNSGMNRLGFADGAYRAAFERALGLQRAGVIGTTLGHIAHFAKGEIEGHVQEAVARFRAATQGLPGPVSLCNSAATLGCSLLAAQTDWVRPGICLYGATPFEHGPSAAALGLLPAMALRSTLIGLQEVTSGEAVGYGGIFVAEDTTRVGIVACGYADGYPRHALTGTPIVVDGVRTRLLGRVSMDMLAVDLGPVPQARVGLPVTLWGADGLSVDEVATAAGTIGYELLTAVTARVKTRVAEE
ncbi:alanine racemase [Verticiella sediminum]|uniref:Alanine racemase n=1 Tax=Verticiella sediminum TaxID=1247510 RepID=A0A556ABJ6_9BURK|nr:alanine racemase [Verticiella sediminum]TSH90276.1 alanine racemase [Verticiella sediminum]